MSHFAAAYDDVSFDLVRGPVPDEARRVRILGCPDTRRFEVLELGGMLFLREIETQTNPVPGPFVMRADTARLFNAMAVDVLKANDGAI